MELVADLAAAVAVKSFAIGIMLYAAPLHCFQVTPMVRLDNAAAEVRHAVATDRVTEVLLPARRVAAASPLAI